jgi:hypothetical protein
MLEIPGARRPELEGAWHFSGTGSAVGLPAIPQNI